MDLQDPIQMSTVTCQFGAIYPHSLTAYVFQVPTVFSLIFRPTLPTVRNNGLDLWGLLATLHPQPIPSLVTLTFSIWYMGVLVPILLLGQNKKQQREERVYPAYTFGSQTISRKLKQTP